MEEISFDLKERRLMLCCLYQEQKTLTNTTNAPKLTGKGKTRLQEIEKLMKKTRNSFDHQEVFKQQVEEIYNEVYPQDKNNLKGVCLNGQ